MVCVYRSKPKPFDRDLTKPVIKPRARWYLGGKIVCPFLLSFSHAVQWRVSTQKRIFCLYSKSLCLRRSQVGTAQFETLQAATIQRDIARAVFDAPRIFMAVIQGSIGAFSLLTKISLSTRLSLLGLSSRSLKLGLFTQSRFSMSD